MSGGSEAERARPGLGARAPGRARRAIVAVAIVLLLSVAGVGVWSYLSAQQGTTLVVYTYDSLLGGGCGGNASAAVHPFEVAHDVHIRFECPGGTLVSALTSQQGGGSADLVVGLDEITTPEAEAAGLLVPYAPPALAAVPPDLVSALSPDHGAVPYEWGYLGIDACASFASATGGATAHLTFPELAANASWAKNLIVEDPASDITGEEFLLWEIAYYTDVLHQPWTSFWSAVAPHMTTASDWGTAFQEFTCAPATPGLVVSYLEDPAYAAANGIAGAFNSSVSWWNGTAYGWKSVYGVGIVAGTHHLALDQAFENWFLSGPLQSQLPTTEWEIPANATVPVPPVFGWAMNTSDVVPLNPDLTPSEIVNGLTPSATSSDWIDEWQAAVNGAG